MRSVVVIVVAAATAAVSAAATSPPEQAAAVRVPTVVGEPRIVGGVDRASPLIVAVGDVAAEGGVQQATADVAATLLPDRVIGLGDLAYDSGTIDEFRDRWQPTWGRFDDILWPLPGNHEYITPGAAGYREYFGVGGRTWWARRAGAWLVIGLDSQKASDPAQLRFLRRRLAENDGRPTIVAWHHPRFSSGEHGDSTTVQPLWAVVSVDPDVRIALWGHDHDYEHLAIPVAGRTTKVHAFVVGTGGIVLRPFTRPLSRYTVVRFDDEHGVLSLRLRPTGWRWAFVATDGARLEGGWRSL